MWIRIGYNVDPDSASIRIQIQVSHNEDPCGSVSKSLTKNISYKAYLEV